MSRRRLGAVAALALEGTALAILIALGHHRSRTRVAGPRPDRRRRRARVAGAPAPGGDPPARPPAAVFCSLVSSRCSSAASLCWCSVWWRRCPSGITAASYAFRVRVALPPAPRPRHPVLFYNPRSGGGKAARYHLADEARARGIEADRARARVGPRAARSPGAGRRRRRAGDGRRVTARRRPSPASRPSGASLTRVSRPAPATISPSTSASIATTSSGRSTRWSTGASAWSTSARSTAASSSTTCRSGCTARRSSSGAIATPRSAPCSTRCRRSGPGSRSPTCDGSGPDGDGHEGSVAIVVSNNPYRLGPAMGAGSRPRLDQGVLGVAVLGAPGDDVGVRAWTTPIVRGRGAGARARWCRRRGAGVRSAAAFPRPPGSPALSHRPPPPRRFAVGLRPRARVGGGAHPGRHRRWT